MKRLLPYALAFVLSSSAMAAPPEGRVILLVGTTEQAQQRAAEFSDRLKTVTTFEQVAMGSEAAQMFRPGSEDATYLIRMIAGQIVWQRVLGQGEDVLEDFQTRTYDLGEDQLLAWSSTSPASSTEPLRRDDLVEFYAGGRPGLEVAGQIGEKTVKMYEDQPGYYSGVYRVATNDRAVSDIKVRAQDSSGSQEVRDTGKLSLEGVEFARVTGMGQKTLRDWVFQGEASPGTKVQLHIDIRLGSLFGQQKVEQTVETIAGDDGKFEAIAQLGTLTSSPIGRITLKTIDGDGVEVLSPAQDVRFRSRVRNRVSPWGFGAGWGFGPRFWGRRGCRPWGW